MPGRIFVNYRRQEESHWHAQVIARRLEEAFGTGQVFLDDKNIRPSAKYADEIRSELEQASALIVVMAEDWHKVQDKDSGAQRIWQESDWVRAEIRTALLRKVPIFPILIDNAKLPKGDWLPEDIRPFLDYQYTQVRANEVDADLERVIAELADVTKLPRSRSPASNRPRSGSSSRKGLQTPGIVASRAPVVIAIEEERAKLKEEELLAAERHLTVTLRDGALPSIQARLREATSVEAILELGGEAWNVLKAASNGIDNLIRQLPAQTDDSFRQPIAWTGRLDLLTTIYRAILIARVHEDGVDPSFLSVAYGSHYFHPLRAGESPRSMQPRKGDSQSNVRIGLIKFAADEEGMSRILSGALEKEVVVVDADTVDEPVNQLVKLIPHHPTSPTRIVMAFGTSSVGAPLIDAALTVVPCVSFAGPSVRSTVALSEIEVVRAFNPALKTQAAPVVISRLRAHLIREQLPPPDGDGDGDVNLDALRDALEWSTWSWVGRPLFSTTFEEVEKATCSHLLDLRAVASSDWYFERTADIPHLYQTAALTARDLERRFHLYLSGAGGTGKSCFLRSIYDKLEVNDSNSLPVWYKVHAPNSEWTEVETQIKKEVRYALMRRFPTKSLLVDGDDRKEFSNFLLDLLKKLNLEGITQIVLFIDQLERTFESGYNAANQGSLRIISAELVKLLLAVGVDKGVRVFVASRKHYLADFLSSFEQAEKIHLHFNVLQTLSVETEGARFVKRIVGWCNEKRLTGRRLYIDDDAAKLLADKERGHPLNLMLALIRLLSRGDLPEEIVPETIKELLPGEQLFYVDEALMGKDDLDWYFFLAMAHARTEIVRREEVLWRMGLVSRDLARRTKELGPHGVLERLWLLGHLGRTIHPRPLGEDTARFVEFFHANLRDHLVANVMNRAEAEPQGAGPRRRLGMPPAWRALDRLREIAKDWDHVQQPLLKEDIIALMDHKEVFTERIPMPGKVSKEVEGFYLLFMRDVDVRRETLFRAARECVAYSALAHDVNGRWAFKTLFRNVARGSEREDAADEAIRERRDDSQVGCCRRWLRGKRADSQTRLRILQYLVELRDPHANRLLADLVFDDSADDETWQQLATILAEPLVAATHRSAFLTYTLQHLLDAGVPFSGDTRQAGRLGAFLVSTCSGERHEVSHLLETLPAEVAALGDSRLEPVLRELGNPELVNRWFGPDAPTIATPGRREFYEGSEIELRVGEGLANHVDQKVLDKWMDEVGTRLTFRPHVGCLNAEVSKHRRTNEETKESPAPGYELQLLIRGRLIALGQFLPGRIQTLTRDWDGADTEGALLCFNDALEEPVRWVEEATLHGNAWRYRRWTFDQAVVDWLHDLLRRDIANVFVFDDISSYLSSIAESGRKPRVRSDLRYLSKFYNKVREVYAKLIRERVPVAERNVDLLIKLIDLVREGVLLRESDFDVALVTMRLREHVSDDLCRAFADDTNQLLVLLLDLPDEQWLVSKLNKTAVGLSFDLTPVEELRTVVAIRERFDAVSRADHSLPVLVCADNLRAPLFDMLQHFDSRFYVLSYAELSPEVRLTFRGVIPRFSSNVGAA